MPRDIQTRLMLGVLATSIGLERRYDVRVVWTYIEPI
jgi:hypothetical protein